MAEAVVGRGLSARPRQGEALEFRVIYAISFTLFLAAAVVRRCLPHGGRSPARDRRSVLDEAKAAANSCAAFAFMS